MEYTTVSLSNEAKQLLASNGKKSDTYEKIIVRLIRDNKTWEALMNSEHIEKLKILKSINKLNNVKDIYSYINNYLKRFKDDESEMINLFEGKEPKGLIDLFDGKKIVSMLK